MRNARFLQTLGLRRLSVYELTETIRRWPSAYASFQDAGGKIYSERFPHGRFDLIICTFVLETICPEAERLSLLAKLRDATKRNGMLALEMRGARDVVTATERGRGVLCPAGEGYITPLKTFIKPYTVPDVIAMLGQVGYEVERAFHRSGTKNPRLIRLLVRPCRV